MKRLTHISADGCKNLKRFDLPISGPIALQGPNGSGKTALFSALRIAVLGYDPELGRTLPATRQLITVGRSDMAIGLSFSDGFGVSRRISGAMETRVTPPKGERTEKEAQARIDEETGAFVLSFDLAAFLSLSVEKRRAWLLSTLPRSAVDLDVEQWRHWLGYEDGEEFIQRGIDRLWHQRVVAEQSIIDGLASALEYTREQFNDAEQKRLAQVKISEAADRAATELSSVPGPDPAEFERVQAELADAERRRGEADQRMQSIEAAAEQRRRHEHELRVAALRIDRAQSELQAADAQLTQYDSDAHPDVVSAAADVERIEATISAQPLPRAEEMIAAAAALTRAETKLRAQRDAVQFTAEERKAVAEALKRTYAQIAAIGAGERCPTCGSAEGPAAREQLRAQLHGLENESQRTEDDYQAALHKEKELGEAVVTAQGAHRALEGHRTTHEALTHQLATATARLGEAKKRAAEYRGHLEQALQRARAGLQAANDEQQRMAQLTPPEPDDPSTTAVLVDRLSTRATQLRDRQVQLQGAERLAGKAEAERERADHERHELERRTAKAESLKRLRDAQMKLRAHVIQQLVGPVEATANEVLRAIDEQKTFRFLFEREGKETFDFGFEEQGVFRSYDAASTGEDAFLAIVLVAALIAACAPPWRVLLVDNIEGVDSQRRRWLMLALSRLTNRIGNIIVAGCCDFADIEGWAVVDMERLSQVNRESVAA